MAAATKRKLMDDPSVVNGDAVDLPAEDFGHPRAKGHWASCIQIVDPLETKEVIETVFLEDNEAVVSMAAVPFTSTLR